MKRSMIFLSVWAVLAGVDGAAGKSPTVLKTPNSGIQPQAVMDGTGVLHLVYFKGKDGGGDLFYVRRDPGKEFSEPLRVNSQPGSAVAVGTIRGAQLTLGKDHRVHVAWNGSSTAQPRGPNDGAPMLYSRLADDGKTFEPQRNLMRQTFMLDGGGTVAADREGNVYVSWHALKVGSASGEENRQVWVARSTDDGKSFGQETLTSSQSSGVCGCCGMRAFLDSKGTLHLLYRSATQKSNRDMCLLSSSNQGKTFQRTLLQNWRIDKCPMSSEAFAEGVGGVVAAWDTDSQVYFSRMAPGTGKVSKPVGAPGAGKVRKHPALAVGPKGETVLVWTEGTAWNRGGALAWQVFDAAGKPTAEKGRLDGAIPVWGLPTVVAGTDGEIVVIH